MNLRTIHIILIIAALFISGCGSQMVHNKEGIAYKYDLFEKMVLPADKKFSYYHFGYGWDSIYFSDKFETGGKTVSIGSVLEGGNFSLRLECKDHVIDIVDKGNDKSVDAVMFSTHSQYSRHFSNKFQMILRDDYPDIYILAGHIRKEISFTKSDQIKPKNNVNTKLNLGSLSGSGGLMSTE